MKTTRVSQRGQVIIIFVFAIVGLVAITGLAIDGGTLYSDRRSAQNAADTAALAGAVVRVNAEKGGATGCSNLSSTCGSSVALAALNRASDNGYHNDIVNNTVEVHTPPIDGPYSHSTYAYNADNYVQVIINTNVNTFFARVLGIGQLHNRVEAVALAKHVATHSLYGGAAFASLQPNGCGTFTVTGAANLTLNNGANIFVNSDSTSCAAFVLQHCGELTINPQTPVGVVGGSSVPTCTLPNQTTTTTPASAVQFPPDPIFPRPAACSASVYTGGGVWNNSDNTYHFPPGHYSSLSLPQSKASTFDPGVYCVDSIIKGTGNNSAHYGHGVFFWIQAGGEFDWEGGTTILSAPDDTTIASAPETAPYKGYLMYVDWNSNTVPGSMTCTLNGNGTSSYIGTIFAPFCRIQLNGTSGAGGWQAQMIGYNFIVNGTTDITFDHNGTPATIVPEINWTGLFR